MIVLSLLRHIQTSGMFWLWLRTSRPDRTRLGQVKSTLYLPPTAYNNNNGITLLSPHFLHSHHTTTPATPMRVLGSSSEPGVSLYNLYPECKHSALQNHLFANNVVIILNGKNIYHQLGECGYLGRNSRVRRWFLCATLTAQLQAVILFPLNWLLEPRLIKTRGCRLYLVRSNKLVLYKYMIIILTATATASYF